MLDKKVAKKNIKPNYSKEIYKFSKKIIEQFNEENEFLEFIEKIKNYSKEELNDLYILFNKNCSLVRELIRLDVNIKNISFYMNSFDHYFLESHLDLILELDFTNPIINAKLSSFKDDYLELINICSLKEIINNPISYQVDVNLILDNFGRYCEIIKMSNNKDEKLVEALLKINSVRYDQLKNYWDLYYEKIKKTSNPTLENMKKIVFEFLIYNPQYIEEFHQNINTKDHVYSVNEFFKGINSHKTIEDCILFINQEDMKFDDKKEYFLSYFFNFSDDKLYVKKLNDMLSDSNNSEKYPIPVKEYLKMYKKLLDCSSSNELLEFYMEYKEMNIISATEMQEYIVVDYNEHINNLLTKTDDLRQNENVTLSQEEYISKKYFEGEAPKKGTLEIFTMQDVPFTFLLHGLVNENLFANKLSKNPEMWINSTDKGSNYISESLCDENSIGLFGNPNVLLGFNEVHNKQILASNQQDNFTSCEFVVDNHNTMKLVDPSELLGSLKCEATQFNYNEVVSDRKGVLPNFLLVASDKNQGKIPLLNDDVKEWALYYNIPIFVVDCESYFKTAYNKFLNYYNQLLVSPTIPTMEEVNILLDLLRSANTFSPNKVANVYDLLKSLINKQVSLENLENYKNIIERMYNSNEFEKQDLINSDKTKVIYENRKYELGSLMQLVEEYNNEVNMHM